MYPGKKRVVRPKKKRHDCQETTQPCRRETTTPGAPIKAGHEPIEWTVLLPGRALLEELRRGRSYALGLLLERCNTTTACRDSLCMAFVRKFAKVLAGPARPELKSSTGSEGLCFRLPLAETVGIPYCTGKLS